MENPRRLGPVRFIIAAGAALVLIPMVFSAYGITGEDSPAAVLSKLIQVIPFGKTMLSVLLLPLSDTMSNFDSFSDWLKAHDFSMAQHLAMNAGKLVFSGAILKLSEKIFRNNMVNRSGVLNKVADVMFTTLFVFLCGFVTDWMFQWLDIIAVKDLDGILRDAAIYIYSGLMGIGSIVLIVISGIVLVDAVLSVALSCFKMIVTYMGIICVLAYYVQTGSILLPAVGCCIWFALVVAIQKGEQLVL